MNYSKNNSHIDSVDRRVIYELDQNARQSFASIAKKIKISEEAVRYRVNHLLDKKIILNFLTILDTNKVGNTYYKIFLKLRNVDEVKATAIINHLVNADAVNWVTRMDSIYHIGFTIRTKSALELSRFTDELRRKFTQHIYNLTFAVNIEVEFFARNYLIGIKRKNVKLSQTTNRSYEVDDRDLKIVRALAQDPRIAATKIASELGISSETVGLRIRNMEKNGLIIGYRAVLNYSKVGILNWYVLIYANWVSEERLKSFTEFCRGQAAINYFIKALGEWDYELSIEVENLEEYRSLMMEMTKQYSDIIRDYSGMVVNDIFKLTLVP